MDGIENGLGQGGVSQPPLHARIQTLFGGVIQGALDAGIILKVVAALLITLGMVGMLLMWQTGPDEPVVALWYKPNVTVSVGGKTSQDYIRCAKVIPRFNSSIYCIHITSGRYVENIVIDYDKTNIAFVNDALKTVIAANGTCGNHHCEL